MGLKVKKEYVNVYGCHWGLVRVYGGIWGIFGSLWKNMSMRVSISIHRRLW